MRLVATVLAALMTPACARSAAAPADTGVVVPPPAVDHHQDFLERNRSNRYIVVNHLPKLAALKRLFASEYRAKPVLVGPSMPR